MLVSATKKDRRAPFVEHNLDTCTCRYEFNKLDYNGKYVKGYPTVNYYYIVTIFTNHI